MNKTFDLSYSLSNRELNMSIKLNVCNVFLTKKNFRQNNWYHSIYKHLITILTTLQFDIEGIVIL